VLIDSRTISGDSVIARIRTEASNILHWEIASVVVLTLCLAKGFSARTAALVSHYSPVSFFTALIIHVGLFLTLLFVSSLVFDPSHPGTIFTSYLWILLVALAVLSVGFIFTSVSNWKRFLTREIFSILVTAIGGVIIFTLSLYSQQYWGLLTGFTLGSTKIFL
jgi:hypothetical protein